MGIPGQDRRQFPRSTQGFPVPIEDKSPLEYVENVSGNGILAQAVECMKPMTQVELVLDVPPPGDYRDRVRGRVVRCQADKEQSGIYYVGVLLTHLSQTMREAIIRYVEHDLRKQRA